LIYTWYQCVENNTLHFIMKQNISIYMIILDNQIHEILWLVSVIKERILSLDIICHWKKKTLVKSQQQWTLRIDLGGLIRQIHETICRYVFIDIPWIHCSHECNINETRSDNRVIPISFMHIKSSYECITLRKILQKMLMLENEKTESNITLISDFGKHWQTMLSHYLLIAWIYNVPF